MTARTKGVVYTLWALGLAMITAGLHQLIAHPQRANDYHWSSAPIADNHPFINSSPPKVPAPESSVTPSTTANPVAPVDFELGDEVQLINEGSPTVAVSHSAPRWNDEDIFVRVSSGTRARVVSKKEFPLVGGHIFVRY